MTEHPLHTMRLDGVVLNQGGSTSIPLSYQVFGPELGTAPVILVNHALTGNSLVAGELGWWNAVIGENKVIDTNTYTILAFNVPGNGFDHFLIDNYRDFVADDIANMFLLGLDQLNVTHLHTLIGGSLGGAIGWHMLVKRPDLAQNFIPVATDWKTTDWLHAVCLVQEDLLNTPDFPLQKARRHAMLCYRTPKSLNERFDNEMDVNKQVRKSQDWLDYHGNALSSRFSLSSYKLMNQLLKTLEATPVNEELTVDNLATIEGDIYLIAIDSDMLFPAFEIKQSYEILKQKKENVYYHEIHSPHGHDAFLMEYEQLVDYLKPIFSKTEKKTAQTSQNLKQSKA